MADVKPQPIDEGATSAVPAHSTSAGNSPPTVARANIDALIATIQQEFPSARIRITGRARTVRRQAELMAERRMRNRQQFLGTYRAAPHIAEMDQWVADHPQALQQDVVVAFVEIIERARRNGAVVSNHLSDYARDISIPVGDDRLRNQIRQRLQQLGVHVLDETDAVGGPHWHIDY